MSAQVSFIVLGVVLAVQAVALVPLRPWLHRRGASLRVALQIAFALGLSGAAALAAFHLTALELERHATVMWLWVCASTMLVGLVSAARVRRMPTLELAVGALVPLEVAAALAFAASAGEGLTAAPLRALLIAPAALALCAYFGASVGYLLRGGGRVDVNLGYESMVGRRFLLSKASQVLSTVTAISVIGVSLGVWLVIVALAILGGFERDLQKKIIGANAHVVVQATDGAPFAPEPGLLETIQGVPGVVAAAPFVQGEVGVASGSNHTAAGLLIGVVPERSPEALLVLRELVRGSLDRLAEAPPAPAARVESEFQAPAAIPGIVIGVEMAKALAVGLGDKIRVLSPLLEVLTPVGVAPKSLGFEVVGIFSSKMYEYDARLAFVSLGAARRFFELDDDGISGVHVRTDDPESSDLVGARIVARLGQQRFEALDWKKRNQTLFAALKLERVVAFIVLVFIILVASFSIVNTLTMSVIEKRKEIAILKTMGAQDIGVMKVFLVQGLLVGAFGTLIGAAVAIATVAALTHFGFWIPGDVYYIDSLPVHLEAADVVLVVVAALLIVWNFSVFPALRGSQLEPVEGLRDG